MAEQGAIHGQVVCAQRQNDGHGRCGRSWISLPGNLFWSVILRPTAHWRNLLHLPHIASLAVCDWHQSIGGTTISIKWPNDILLKKSKVAGILLETAPISQREAFPAWIIMGIGINLRHAPKDHLELSWPATCLADHGLHAPIAQACEQLRHHVLARLDAWLIDGFAPLRHDIEGLLAHRRGDTITIRSTTQDPPVQARWIGIDEDGLLKAEVAGRIRRFSAGDILPNTPPYC